MGRALAQARGTSADAGGDAESVPTDFSQEDFWRWATRQTGWNIFGGSDNPLGQAWAGMAPVRLGGHGVPATADLSHGREALRFVLRIRQPQAQLPTTDGSSQVRIAGGRLRIPTHTAAGEMAAMAAAETYYARPVARPDGGIERANLFQPYWQARLVPVRDDERAQARALQGVR
jgi:hypothetical protein